MRALADILLGGEIGLVGASSEMDPAAYASANAGLIVYMSFQIYRSSLPKRAISQKWLRCVGKVKCGSVTKM